MYIRFKRISDIVVSALGIAFLMPFMVVLVLAIKLDSPGPIFFRQRRVGINRMTFDIMKFRTMSIDTPKDTPTHMLENPEKYITRVGKVLRKTSLDELPQIFNILKGDMSVVGPRPALWNQYDLLDERDKYGANSIRPGLTGWAQIHGRDEISIAEKAKLDGYYFENIGLWMDVKCFFGTFVAVVKSEGFAEGGGRNKKSSK